jgi:hypothetical protein
MTSHIDPSIIDAAYPIAGQDNDTAGFHNNYLAIQTNFLIAHDEIVNLQANSLSTLGPTYTGNFSANNVSINGKLTVLNALQFANLTTAQIASITNTSPGMTVYNYNTGNIQVYNGTKWANIVLS